MKLIQFFKRLIGPQRTEAANLQLGLVLAFIAGATNTGGFIAVQQYSSHMTGLVSEMADNLAAGAYDLALSGVGGLASFIGGAMLSELIVNYARKRQMASAYALPLLLEATLLMCISLWGGRLDRWDGLFVPMTVMLLCLIMGLQNAVITRLSNGKIRATHITGIVTDIGIELGRLSYWNSSRSQQSKVTANRPQLRLLTLLAVFFFLGGMGGAVGFQYFGYVAALPLAMALGMLTVTPICEDVFFRKGKAPREIPLSRP
jgi:uncharacterized membrane protein YoaK (UPF0700 family)